MVEFEDALKGYHRDFVEADTEDGQRYRPIVPSAILAMIFGVLSVLTFMGWLMAIFPILGLIFGLVALRALMASPEDVSGFQPAVTGIVLSLLFWLGGYAYLVYDYYYLVPFGYDPITFEELAADTKTGELPRNIVALAKDPDRPFRVFIEGEMHPGKHLRDIDRFLLVETTVRSKYQSIVREPTESIQVYMTAGRKIDHRGDRVRVGGILTIHEDVPTGETPYRIDADIFR